MTGLSILRRNSMSDKKFKYTTKEWTNRVYYLLFDESIGWFVKTGNAESMLLAKPGSDEPNYYKIMRGNGDLIYIPEDDVFSERKEARKEARQRTLQIMKDNGVI